MYSLHASDFIRIAWKAHLNSYQFMKCIYLIIIYRIYNIMISNLRLIDIIWTLMKWHYPSEIFCFHKQKFHFTIFFLQLDEHWNFVLDMCTILYSLNCILNKYWPTGLLQTTLFREEHWMGNQFPRSVTCLLSGYFSITHKPSLLKFK